MAIYYDLILVPPNTTGDYPFTWGIIMVDQDAFAAGTVPDPESDVSGPWLVWHQDHLSVVASVNVPISKWTGPIRARRRVSSRSDVVAIFESGGMAGALDISMGGRVLLALP